MIRAMTIFVGILAIFVGILLLTLPAPAKAWDGFDYQAGSPVEIEKGERVRTGSDIEFFDYNAGEYRYGTVESIERFGGSVEVEVLDHESGEIRTLEMEQ